LEANSKAEWLAFIDESTINIGRFAATAVVLLKATALDRFRSDVQPALREVKEFKWNELGDGRQARTADRLLDVVFQFAESEDLRVVALSWDKDDSRNRVIGRDDYENLGRMLFHLINNAVRATSGVTTIELRYDEQDQVEWRTVARSVNARLAKTSLTPRPEILFLNSAVSHEEPGVQVADLFAGLAAYCRARTLADIAGMSKAEKSRWGIISKIVLWLRPLSPVYFSAGEGIVTERSAVINLWPYRALGDYDRAPTKASKSEPRLVSCSNPDCDGVYLDEYGVKRPLCPAHYAEERSERERIEAAAVRRERQAHGTHYCVNCVATVIVNDSMRRLNQRTYEYDYRCPTCGGPLDALAGTGEPAPVEFERDLEGSRHETLRERPPGLSRPSYRDDD
jgi:predicted RNA-binding Zn-ribbon protein involved in translation (DUF1610 family)